jgi:tRNA threonylcarbamoyladenosine biosynthesis protein TsaE
MGTRAGPIALTTGTPEETRALGAAVAGLLVPGDVVSLTGDLGAGKTCLVQGAAAALGVTDPVTSPTFVLVREYRGDLPVYHLDVFRLDRIQEVLDLGFEDLLDPSGVMFIEWGDAIDTLLPDSFLEIRLAVGEDGDTRLIEVAARGRAWAPRWERLEGLLGTWRAA